MRLWEVKQEQQKLPIAFYLMRELRLLMLLLIGGSYIFTNEAVTHWKLVFVIASMLIYTITHFLHFNRRTTKYHLVWTSIDFMVTVVFGIIFPTLTLYQINFGIVGITLLIFTNHRRTIQIACLSFSIAWIYLWTLDYLYIGSFRVMDMLVNLGFLLKQMLLGIIIISPTCMLGGVYWPIELVPDIMQKIALFAPQYWAMEGFKTVMTSGGTLLDVLDSVGILLGFAAIFMTVGISRVRYD